MRYLKELTKLAKPQYYTAMKVRSALPVKKVPEQEMWRLGLMETLMKIKNEKYRMVEDTQHICAMLDSLAST